MYDEDEVAMLMLLGVRAIMSAVAGRPLTDKEVKETRKELMGRDGSRVLMLTTELESNEGHILIQLGGKMTNRVFAAGVEERKRLAGGSPVLADGWL